MPDDKPQLDKFKEAARDLGADDDPKRFNERLGKLVKHKPARSTVDKKIEGGAA